VDLIVVPRSPVNWITGSAKANAKANKSDRCASSKLWGYHYRYIGYTLSLSNVQCRVSVKISATLHVDYIYFEVIAIGLKAVSGWNKSKTDFGYQLLFPFLLAWRGWFCYWLNRFVGIRLIFALINHSFIFFVVEILIGWWGKRLRIKRKALGTIHSFIWNSNLQGSRWKVGRDSLGLHSILPFHKALYFFSYSIHLKKFELLVLLT